MNGESSVLALMTEVVGEREAAGRAGLSSGFPVWDSRHSKY